MFPFCYKSLINKIITFVSATFGTDLHTERISYWLYYWFSGTLNTGVFPVEPASSAIQKPAHDGIVEPLA